MAKRYDRDRKRSSKASEMHALKPGNLLCSRCMMMGEDGGFLGGNIAVTIIDGQALCTHCYLKRDDEDIEDVEEE